MILFFLAGLGIYFCYGVWHSKMRKDKCKKLPENSCDNGATWETNNFARLQ